MGSGAGVVDWAEAPLPTVIATSSRLSRTGTDAAGARRFRIMVGTSGYGAARSMGCGQTRLKHAVG